MNSKADTRAKDINLAQPIPQAADNDLIIVAGTREKRRILDAYEKQFGSGYPDSIVTSKKGKLVSTASDLPSIPA